MCCCCCNFNSYSSRCVEISLVILNIISFALSAIALYFIKWKNVSKISLIIMLLILLLSILLFLFSIIIRCWRNSGSIKTTKKESATRLSCAGLALSIILFIICVFGDIVLGFDFNKANYPCGTNRSSYNYYNNNYYYKGIRRNLIDKNSIDCNNYSGEKPYIEVVTLKEYVIAYCCFSYTEIAMIVAMFLWRSLKIRIINEIDGSLNQPVITQQPVYGAQYPPYGYGEQIQPQYVYVQRSEQYGMQTNMYDGGYNNNQYQQQNAMPVQQGGNGNYNVMMKNGGSVPVVNSQDYSTGRNMRQ